MEPTLKRVQNTPALDEYALRLVKFRARQVCRRLRLGFQDRQDLEQELLLDLLNRLPKYRSSRSRRNTFVSRLIDHRIATFIANLLKHRARWPTVAIVSPGQTREPGVVSEDQLADPAVISAHEHTDLHLDLLEAVAALPRGSREVCARLCIENVTEIARTTGKSRSTIYRLIKALRKLWQDKPLSNYIKR